MVMRKLGMCLGGNSSKILGLLDPLNVALDTAFREYVNYSLVVLLQKHWSSLWKLPPGKNAAQIASDKFCITTNCPPSFHFCCYKALGLVYPSLLVCS